MGVRLRFSRALASKRLMYKRQTDSDQPSISFNQFDIFVCIYILIYIYIYVYHVYDIYIYFDSFRASGLGFRFMSQFLRLKRSL